MDAQESSTTRRRGVVVTVTVVVAVVAGLGWAWHWRTHPTVFAAAGNETGMRLTGDQDTVYLGVVDASGTGGSISLESARPRVTTNTADASVTLHVCTIDRTAGGGVGVTYADGLPEDCLTVEPVQEGTTLALDDSQQIIAEVTVGRPGVVRVEGVELTYSHRWQRGTQTTGSHLQVRRD